jgi:hypothetical protein
VADATGCSRVDLDLDAPGDLLLLSITGDGAAETGPAAAGPPPDTIAYLARLLGGRVERQLRKGGGREFRLTLPVSETTGSEDPRALS